MSDDVIAYFVRHYTLVLDNQEASANAVADMAQDAIVEEGPTLADYTNMSTSERETAYADAVGQRVVGLIEELVMGTLDQSAGLGTDLIKEVVITNGAYFAWSLGKHYLPEPRDMEGLLDEDDEDETPDES